MKSYGKILLGAAMLQMPFFFTSCVEEMGKPVCAELEIQSDIFVGPEEGIYEAPLVSTYPWYASTNVDWIKITKNRGQALLKEKLVFKVQANRTLDVREATIYIKLMDQLTGEFIVRQNGQGEYIILPIDKVYFNNQVSEHTVTVQTKVDWTLDKSQENGISFEKVDLNHLKIKSGANSTGKELSASVNLTSVNNPERKATLTVFQKAEKDIIAFVVPEEDSRGKVVMKSGSKETTLGIVLNKKVKISSSADWLRIVKTPLVDDVEIVQNVEMSYTVSENPGREERTAYITVQDEASPVNDVYTIYQRGVEDIVYCKTGGTGDGTSWDRAYGNIIDAMNACGHFASQELWVSEGEFELSEVMVKKYVNVYGGFKGDEIALAQRDQSKKTVLKGKQKFLAGYRMKEAVEDYYMDGFVITGVDEPDATHIGIIEFYDHHVLRNCIVRDNVYGKNAGGYFENTKVINSLFYNNHNTASAGVVQFSNTDCINCTIVGNKNTGDWGAGGGMRAASGSRFINTVVWGNLATTKRAENVQVYIDKSDDVEVVNCFFQMGLKKDGITPAMFNDGNTPKGDKGYTVLAADNAAGARFVNPSANDYSLGEGSVLIDAGNAERLEGMDVYTDIVGNDRIIGGNPDVGAYEKK